MIQLVCRRLWTQQELQSRRCIITLKVNKGYYNVCCRKAMREAVQMEGEFMEVLQCVIRRYLSVAMEDREFYLMLMNLYFSARETEGYKAARPYIVQLLKLLQEFFERVAQTHAKIQEKEKFLSISLTGIINTYMLVVFEGDISDEMMEDPTIVTDIASQFAMYA